MRTVRLRRWISGFVVLAGCPAKSPPDATATASSSTSLQTTLDDPTGGATTGPADTTGPGTTGTSTTTTGEPGTSTTTIGTTSTSTATTGECVGYHDYEPPSCDPTDGGTTGGDPDPCACIPDDPWADTGGEPPSLEWPSKPTCGDEICPAITAQCSGEVVCAGYIEGFDEAAVDCALKALRDRTPGVIQWAIDPNNQFTYEGYVKILNDGSVVLRTWNRIDLGYVVSDATHGFPPAPCFFDACLALAQPAHRLWCLNQLTVTPIDICDDGWSGTA